MVERLKLVRFNQWVQPKDLTRLGQPVWKWVLCPKKNMQPVSWSECLACNDLQKDPRCPILAIRSDIAPNPQRRYRPGQYHVTESVNPRNVYYNRYREWEDSWVDRDFHQMDFFIGRAIHTAVQKFYKERQQRHGPKEIELFVKKCWFDPEYQKYCVVGSIDVVDRILFLLLEIKSAISLKYILKDGHKPEHEWQVRAYYECGLETEPEVFEQIKDLRIIYISKTRYSGRYKEFSTITGDFPLAPMPDEALRKNVLELHKSFVLNRPPPNLCGVPRPNKRRFPCMFCGPFDQCFRDWEAAKSE